MPRADFIARAAAVAILVMLPVGFAYSGAATARLYWQLLRGPGTSGRDASIDANMAVVHLSGGEQLRAAVGGTRWPVDEDVVIEADKSALSKEQVVQFYYSAGYLLYPRKVWLAPAPGRAHHAIVIDWLNRLNFVDRP